MRRRGRCVVGEMREGEVSGVAAAGAAVGERPRQVCGEERKR
jgi:hypothetical protein